MKGSPAKDIGGSFIHSYGTKVFLRPRLDMVQDAIAQSKFNEKKWVWIQDVQKGYVAAHIVREDKEVHEALVEYESGLTSLVPLNKIYPMNPPKFDKVEDMADLTYLNEPSVIYNLSMRYKSHFIYTYSGLFLVAINPYKDLPIYSDEYLQSYKGRRRGELAPHIYAVADQAYHDMVRNNENQSILITGESGAGKTENTKRVIQYLTSVASERGHPDLGQRTTDKLGMQILQANPILEAFGNAQTIRNNNSSRFGKFIRIEFNQRAHICGANIEWYLLERSRIHQQSLKERGYHVFYQLLSSDKETKEKLLLGSSQPEDYGFIKRSNTTIQGVDDAEEYRHLLDAMDIMGLSEKERFGLFRIVAAVLHLGNIVVTKDYRGDRADINDFTVVEKVCHLLGIPAQDFKNSLLSPRIKAGRDWVNQSKSPAQVITSLDVLAKTLYERSFAALVERINKAIDTQKSVDRMGFIGVLDIAGFEIFEVNSFEQLCINYTNEKLQQFFNHNMFELEQEEYEKEKIEWSYIDFGLDLQPTIDLIEKTNPVGIISCLEEECVAPRGTDNRFLEKLNTIWDRGDPEQKYKSTRFKDGFIIKHYAGDVEYVTNGWIDKNKDPLNEDTTRLLARSNFHYVASLFEDYLDTDSEVTRDSIRVRSELTLMKLRKGGGSFRTVGQRHKQQLLSLMNTLYTTHPHFVRCIVPNHGKKAGEIDTKLVLDQLRCNGVLEGIRICRTGYPNRLSFADFRKRYEILCPNRLKPNSFIDGQSASQALLDAMKLEHEKYRIGVTKVFFKATVLAELEERRDKTLSEYVAGFQAICRRYMARQKMQRCVRQTEAIRVMQRNARIYVTLREWPWWKIYAKLKPLNVAYRVDTQIKEKDQKIATLTSQIKDYQIHAAQLADDNETLLSQQTDYKTLLMNAQTMVHELEEGKQDLLDKLTLAEEHGEEVEHLLQDTREQLETSDQKAQTQATLIARLHQDILECSQDNERLADQCNAYHETHQTMVVQLASVTKRNEEADKEKESLQASLMALKKKEEEWKLQQQKDIQARTHLESDYKAQHSQFLRKEQASEKALSELKTAFDKQTAELEAQRQAHQQAESTIATLQDKLKALTSQLASESELNQQHEKSHGALQTDWESLVHLVQSEATEARARADRMEQVINKLVQKRK